MADELEVPFWMICDSDIADTMISMEYSEEQIKEVFADKSKLDKIRVEFEQRMDSRWRDVMEEAIEEVAG